MIAVSNHSVAVSIVVLCLFIAFLIAMGAFLVKLVVHARKDGSGALSGCLLATGFGFLTIVLAAFAFAAGAVTIGVAAGPDIVDETLTRLDGIERRAAEHRRSSDSQPSDSERNDAQRRDTVRREVDAALDEAARAYDEALATARDAGATARSDVRAALQEAAQAMQEARDTMREALRDVRTAVRDRDGAAPHAAPAGPRMELRLDVTGDPGEALAQLVDRVVGHEAEVAILREEGGGTARWVFVVPARPTEQVAALEDELRAELAKLALPDGVRVEFRDVVLQDEQHHEQR
ncbi:MAG: hypothetical protein EPO68_17610 [Planctomycetota bacterium]|nr:MAG: hypothetical protein EPO68_17610 [Planctomycetota bacterium]